jgi:hypothetical protein
MSAGVLYTYQFISVIPRPRAANSQHFIKEINIYRLPLFYEKYKIILLLIIYKLNIHHFHKYIIIIIVILIF